MDGILQLKCTRRMLSTGMLCRVVPVRTDVLGEPSASIIRVTVIGELGTTLVVTSNRRMLRRYTMRDTDSCHHDDGGATFLRDIGSCKSYKAKHPRRRHSS
jgi:hypothetical protein